MHLLIEEAHSNDKDIYMRPLQNSKRSTEDQELA